MSRKLDPAKQAAFIKKYEDLLNHLDADEVVLFGDAVHPTHAVRPVGCWAPKDTPIAVPQTSGRQRLKLYRQGRGPASVAKEAATPEAAWLRSVASATARIAGKSRPGSAGKSCRAPLPGPIAAGAAAQHQPRPSPAARPQDTRRSLAPRPKTTHPWRLQSPIVSHDGGRHRADCHFDRDARTT